MYYVYVIHDVLTCMRLHVLLEVRPHGIGAGANGADVGLLAAVTPEMHVQVVLRAKPLEAALRLQGAAKVGRVGQLQYVRHKPNCKHSNMKLENPKRCN